MKDESMERHVKDRRVRRTRQMLREALFALIEEEGYDTLTIQDITDRANVGRATFYMHYRDKEELLLESVRETLEELKEQLRSAEVLDILVKKQSLGVGLFRHVLEHTALYRALLSERGAALITTRLRMEMAEKLRVLVIEEFLKVATKSLPGEMVAEYCAAGIWSLVGWWLRNGMRESPEEMGLIFWRLMNEGLIKTLGLPEYEGK